MKAKHYMAAWPAVFGMAIAVVLVCAPAKAGESQLLSAMAALQSHIDGTAPLSGSQIASYKSTIDANSSLFGDSAATINASFDLVRTYEQYIGPMWSAGSPTENGFSRKATSDTDINWAIFNVMQYIVDDTYNSANIATYQGLLNGYQFQSAEVFPGHVTPPANPQTTYTVSIDGSFLDTYGRDTMHWADRPARKATGTYLAPGSIATITVPQSLVNHGYQIRVGGNSWDFSNKDPIDRLDRVSLVYDITSPQVQIASPLGGNIYIDVPYLADAGVVTVGIQNAVRSPFFSMQDFKTTTLEQWRNTERNFEAPWADFQSEKFMMHVPTGWIFALDDPVTLMENWNKALDITNDLMGFPRDRGKETLFDGVDVRIRAGAYAPGYPSVNQTYDPLRNNDSSDYNNAGNAYTGTSNSHLIRGPQYAAYYEFHELGHGYLFPKFPGEVESNVNLLHVAVWNQGFGYDLDYAFAASMGYQNNPHRTLDNTAVAWMTSFNFVNKQPMDKLEKQYQLKGHAKFVEIARMFGWQALGDYYRSFNDDYENGVSYSTDIDSLLLRLSINVGADVTPLFHFWGVHPQDLNSLEAALAAANVTESQQIYDTLVHYKTLVPADNTAFRQFALNWWQHQPSVDGYWTESEHAKQWDDTYGLMYDEDTAAAIRGVIDDLISLYFPRPYIDYPLGDLNLDNVVDALDWPLFLAGMQTDMSTLTEAQAYLKGDLDRDFDNDINDFDLFRKAFEAANPAPGAFAEMLAAYQVPEPASMLGLIAGAAGLALRRRTPKKTHGVYSS